jgi:hypothetical protein
MRSNWLTISCGLILLACAAVPAQAATPAFTITATNVTMPPTGVGLSRFSITAIPMTGTITLSCLYAGAKTDARLPVCPLTPPIAYTVSAGGTLTGTVEFYPYGVPVPASVPLSPGRRGAAAGAALAGVLLLGLRFRRRARRGLSLGLLAVGALAVFWGIGCGGSVNLTDGMTPGTYPYTIAANNQSMAATLPGQTTSTTINVTVP